MENSEEINFDKLMEHAAYGPQTQGPPQSSMLALQQAAERVEPMVEDQEIEKSRVEQANIEQQKKRKVDREIRDIEQQSLSGVRRSKRDRTQKNITVYQEAEIKKIDHSLSKIIQKARFDAKIS